MIPTHVDAQGRVWAPFAVEFVNDEGTFHVTIFATGFEHAELIVQDIRSTAKLVGEIVDYAPG